MHVIHGQNVARALAAAWRRSAAIQTLTYVLLDVAFIWMAVVASYAARFDVAVPVEWAARTWAVGIVSSAVFVGLFAALRLYSVVWRYVGVDVILRLGVATALGTFLLVAADLAATRLLGFRVAPLGVGLMTGVFTFVGAATIRSLVRLQVYLSSGVRSGQSLVLIVGAGDAGSLLLRDIANQPGLDYGVVGFLDDDRRKIGRSIRGVQVLGPIESLVDVVLEKSVDQVFVAVPSATVSERRRILDLCNRVDVTVRVVPGIARDFGPVGVSKLRPVGIEDLLGRDAVEIDAATISETLTGRKVAVTGAAGSIGSELCRQIMLVHPRELLLLEIDETRLYELFLELRRLDSDVPKMHICDVRNGRKVEQILSDYSVDVVFHAAAYKHVPLMELAPDEAVATNVGGTLSVLRACLAAGVGHFVLISTDKAVKPSSVMGATKALAERVALAYARKGLRVSAVRFGNVLGSRGSVVPLFEEQIRMGGPVRVTHPDVTRYFMTIPEAARLVLQAQALSHGGELFVLEMGDPVKIIDLARKMVSLSGSSADIVFEGLRPGEKLHEVLAHDDHSLVPTQCDAVLRLNALPFVGPGFEERVDELIADARWADTAETVKVLASLVHDFVPHARAGVQASQTTAVAKPPLVELALET